MISAPTPTRKPVQVVMLNLPRPISMNRAWRTTVGGRWYLSPEYKAWKTEVGLIANANRVGGVRGPYAMTIRVKAGYRGDVGNVEKCLSDAFQQLGIIENDRFCQKLVIARCPRTEGLSVIVAATKDRSK